MNMKEYFPIADSSCGLLRDPSASGPSVCFPSPVAIGASADPDTAYEAASLIAQSAATEGIPLLLTPAVNRFGSIRDARRSLCFSDDPSLNAEMAAAWIQGLQENGVGAALRFLADEDSSSAEVLQKVISIASPCAIATDQALDIGLPVIPDTLRQPLTDAFDQALQRAGFFLRLPDEFDWGMQHHQARKLARRGIVLLKNEDDLLPIHGNPHIAMIGAAAMTPCFQASGLPPIHCTETLSALQAVRSVSPVQYANGYEAGHSSPDPALIREAAEMAGKADLVLLFLEADEKAPALPECQSELLHEITRVQPKTAVILHTDHPVDLSWCDKVKALVIALPGGQAGGAADIDLLFGAVPFSGRLPFDSL